MTRFAYAAVPMLAAVGLAACVQSTGDGIDMAEDDPLLAVLDTSHSCFMRREARGFGDAPGGERRRDRLYLDTGSRERFVVEVQGACPDLDFSNRMAIDSRTGGSVCTGDVVNLVFASRSAGGDGFCPVRVIGRVPRDWEE